MKHGLLLAAVVLLAAPLSAESKNPIMGAYTEGANPEYRIHARFGIEEWENGKKISWRHQQWFLQIQESHSASKIPSRWASLERTVIQEPENSLLRGAVISTEKNSLEDGTLKLESADLQKGKIELAIVLEERQAVNATIGLKLDNGIIYLDSFKCLGLVKGAYSDSSSVVEYKIPEYSYLLNVPVEIMGFKSEEFKLFDDLKKNLSREDQTALDKFDGCRAWEIDGAIFAGEKPGAAAAGPEGRPGSLTAKEFNDCLARAGISAEGKEKIWGTVRKIYTQRPGAHFK